MNLSQITKLLISYPNGPNHKRNYLSDRKFTLYSWFMNRISIRFFDDREVRAIWDEVNSKWWQSVLDIVDVLNAQDDYTKNRN